MTSTPAAAPFADVVRPHAEAQYAHELAALAVGDTRPRPPRWRLSPQAVVTYLMGGVAADGSEISPKYVGNRRLIEVAVATLATDRALLLLGVPGTAKPGSANISPRQSAVIPRCWSRAQRVLPRSPSATGGITPDCWSRVQVMLHSCHRR